MKKFYQRFFAWTAVVVVLIFSFMLPVLSHGALAVTGSNIVSWMSKAAQVQAATSVMKRCVAKESSNPGTWGFFSQNTAVTETWFVGAGHTNIATGAWLESMVQNKVDDGEIWCENNDSNIVNVFANALGISTQDLICDGEAPGLFYPFITSQSNGKNSPVYNGVCQSVLNDPDFRFNWNKDRAVEYLKKLYENYKTANYDTVGQFLPSFDDVYNFTDKRVAYYTYWNDFTTTCNSGTSYKKPGDPMDEANYWKISYVTDEGKVETRYYSKKDTGTRFDKTSWDNSIVGSSGAHSCNAIAEKLSSSAYYNAATNTISSIIKAEIDAAENAAKERTKDICKSQALYATVEFDSEGNITKESGFAESPSAAYYYIQAKKIVQDPDQARENIINQLREGLKNSNPSLTDEQINAKIAEQEAEIDETWNSLKERAQIVYTTFDKVLTGAGAGTGDGNPETSYWHEDSSGNIVCTDFQDFDGTISNDSGYQDILDNLINGATGSTGDIPGQNPGGNSDAPSCFTDGDSLGWILCPTLKMVGSAAAAAYTYIEENWLKMDTSFLAVNTGTYDGWRQIRDFANIIFIISFVIIILAQVTGIGISNYNIKKILPKLIMVAVLVNISFVICQLAVDISNIVGSNLYDLLRGLDTGNGSSFGVSNLVGGLLATIGTGTIGTIVLGGLVVAAVTSPGAVLIPAFIGILGALIGLLFFFIILAVRQAGVIILVVLAPAAIVCYALPNTKQLFDKWKRLFMSLLMVYPICAVMMGGGYFASNLILKSGENGFVETLVAMLLQIVPIFLIPGVLRSSMVMMGNIGAKISAMGARTSLRAKGAVANAEMTKRAATSMNYWGATKGQGVLSKVGGAIGKIPGVKGAGRLVGKIPGVGRATKGISNALRSGQNRRVAQNKIAYQSMRLKEGSDAFTAEHMTDATIANSLSSQEYKQQQSLIDEAVDNIITDGAEYTDSGGTHKINASDFDGEELDKDGNVVKAGGSLDRALEHYLSQYDATGDESAMTQAKAIAKIMIDRGGDGGRTAVMNKLKKRNFDWTTGTASRTRSFDDLTKYISRDGKWMASLKKEDFGSFRMVSDGSRGAPAPGHADAMHSLKSYNTSGASKVTTSSATNLGQSFFDGYNREIANGTYDISDANYDATATADLIELAKTFERTMADPVTAKDVKASDLNEINKIYRAAYDAQQDQWVAAAKLNVANAGKTDAQLKQEYQDTHGAFQMLTPGQQLKVSHAKLPTGWRKATAADVFAYGSLGLTQGEWIHASSATTARRLNAEEIQRADATDKYNLDVDIKNSAR